MLNTFYIFFNIHTYEDSTYRADMWLARYTNLFKLNTV